MKNSKEMTLLTTCPVCGSTTFEPWERGQPLDLQRCTGCALVRLNTGEQTEIYFNQVEDNFFGDGYLRRRGLFSEQFLLHKATHRIRVIQRFMSSGRLLEIGSGTGELLHVATQEGYDAVGLDYSETLVRYVREKYGVQANVGDVNTASVSNTFDIVVMSHVLEHTTDPQCTLHSIRQRLNPEGLLYVAVPNLDCWESRFHGWGAYEPYHLWYFAPANLRRLLESTGYRVVYLHTWDPLGAWFNTAMRSVLPHQHARAREMVHKNQSYWLRILFIIGMGGLNLVRFVTGLFLTPVRVIQERIHRGEELICIAIKNENGA